MLKDLTTSGCIVDGVPTLKCLEVITSNLVVIASALIMLVLFIMIVWGGIEYLTSFGNPERIKKAQGTLKFAVIGVVLFASAFLIIKTIDVVFGGNKGRLFEFHLPDETGN